MTLYNQLRVMGYYKVKVVEALERSSNNYYDALLILSLARDRKSFDCSYDGIEAEEVFLYRWLMSPSREPLMYRLALGEH